MQHIWTLSDGEHFAGKWELADTHTFCHWFFSMERSVLLVKVGERRMQKRIEVNPANFNTEKLKQEFPNIVKHLAIKLQLDTQD